MGTHDVPAYLDMAGLAERLGITVESVRTYRSRGELPPEDAMFGRTPVWLPSTIDEWEAARPGQGVGGGRPRKDRGD